MKTGLAHLVEHISLEHRQCLRTGQHRTQLRRFPFDDLFHAGRAGHDNPLQSKIWARLF
jgi:hypothetical protein